VTCRIPIILAASLAALVGSVGSASAQLTPLGPLAGMVALWDFRGDVGYDPAHDVYLIAFRTARRGINLVPTTMAAFYDRAGKHLHSFDIINDSLTNIGDGEDIRVAYSPDVSNGLGGFGGFLVIRVYSGGVWAHLVFYPGVAGPRIPVFTEANADKAAVAYSPVDRQFLVAWGGRPGAPPQFVRVDLNGQRIGSPTLLRSERECDSPYPYACDEVDVAWNPTTNEFGVLYNDNGKVLARVRGDGTIAGRSVLGVGSRLGALAVNTNLGNYLAIGNTLTCCRPAGVELNGNGQILAKGEITSALDTAGASIDCLMSLSYSPVSGTFVLVGRQAGANDFATGLVIELNQHGAALASALPLGPYWIVPRVVNPGGAAEWLLMNNQGSVLPVGTATPYGGSDVNLAGCIGLDPFVTLGSGTCVNGGWLPPGMVSATPPPPPPTSIRCLSPDPFTALGEGVCVNGGWVPPGHPLAGPAGPAPPGPPPSPSSCATPDPFVSIAGGVCINGGWVPKGHPLAGGG
jgi:hypothetical protein